MPSLVAVACFIPGRAKNLPAPLRKMKAGGLARQVEAFRRTVFDPSQKLKQSQPDTTVAGVAANSLCYH